MLVNELQGSFGERGASERLTGDVQDPLEHTVRAVERAQDALEPVGRTRAEIQQAEARLTEGERTAQP